ncbi:hypothetical protein MMC31_007721, partial [Peltigera leucophlebia]|nr:hypothetical protein [Peltigera leucophlebia]
LLSIKPESRGQPSLHNHYLNLVYYFELERIEALTNNSPNYYGHDVQLISINAQRMQTSNESHRQNKRSFGDDAFVGNAEGSRIFTVRLRNAALPRAAAKKDLMNYTSKSLFNGKKNGAMCKILGYAWKGQVDGSTA